MPYDRIFHYCFAAALKPLALHNIRSVYQFSCRPKSVRTLLKSKQCPPISGHFRERTAAWDLQFLTRCRSSAGWPKRQIAASRLC